MPASALARQSDMDLLRLYSDSHDEHAFAEIVRRYAGMVYAASFRVLRDRQLAEDSVQETFLRLMRKPSAVSSSLGGWLHRVATQASIDVSRSESARHNRERAHQEEQQELLGDRQSWREVSETLDAALVELPEEARDLLVQYYILGRTQTAIAAQHNTSVPTICRRVAAALEQLRAVLRKQGVSAASLAIVGEFLALRGADALPFTLEQGLGRIRLLAGVRQGWKIVPPRPARLSFWQLKELELAATVIISTSVLVIILLFLLQHRTKSDPGAVAAPTHDTPVAAQR